MAPAARGRMAFETRSTLVWVLALVAGCASKSGGSLGSLGTGGSAMGRYGTGGGSGIGGPGGLAGVGAGPAASGGDAGGSIGGGGTAGGGTAPIQTCIPPASKDNPVARLSQTGCMDPARSTMLAASVIPYQVNSPLWSDGADKTRGMALPVGGKIHVKDCATESAACPQGPADTGKWIFPVGTVMVKSFSFDEKLVETRLFVHFDPATWVGYSYQWDEAQTDATLVPDDRVQIAFHTGQRQVDWHFPNRLDCMQCHTPGAGSTLGPETAQMNRVNGGTNPGGINQIDDLQARGLFDAPLAKPYRSPLVAPYPSQAGTPPADATLEQRARSYLHANCAICHRPDSDFPNLDLRLEVPLEDTHVCGVEPAKSDLGVVGSLILDPGKRENSVLWLRMNTPIDPGAVGKTVRMPQLATYVIDQAAVSLIGDWIASLGGCPQ